MSITPESRTSVQTAGVLVYSVIAAWFIFAVTMAATGQYNISPTRPPLALGLTIAVPMLFFVIGYRLRGPIWRISQKLDMRIVVLAHVWRIVALNFILVAAQGRLPMGFALPAGLGDMITALAAIPIAYGISKNLPSIRNWFIAWNLFGLLDLVNAVTQGILHSSSTFGILAGAGPTTYLMTVLPRSLVPTFLVPLFILLHLLALSRRSEVPSPATQRESEATTSCEILRALAVR
jgi:hypothetical protein